MFSRRIRLAFLMMALLAGALGATAWWLAGEAAHRVLRGRIAAELQAGMLELSADKHRLQAWSLERLLGVGPEPEAGPALAEAMRARIAQLRIQGDEAERLDRARGKPLDGHAQRRDMLARLEAALGASPGEVLAEADLRRILRAGLRDEALALAEERAAADASLSRVRLLAVGAAAALVLLAILLAARFTAALRRPLAALQDGAARLAEGRLDHRIQGLEPNEFGQLADCMNRMAQDLAQSREGEHMLRAGLEREVTLRTAELTRALEELGRTETQRQQLLADIGHELRTPATVIRGEAEVALRATRADANALREVLARIAETSRQLGDLVEDVLLLASAEAGALSVELAEQPPGPVLRAAIEGGRVMARARGIALHHCPDPAPAVVLADAGRLRQVIGALLDNALRYSHPAGEVTLRESQDHAAGLWCVEVLDQGIGVTAEEVPMLFARGYRAAAARAHRADGTGLGLAIARALARRQGGDVTLAPRPGGGTVARLTLPLLPVRVAA